MTYHSPSNTNRLGTSSRGLVFCISAVVLLALTAFYFGFTGRMAATDSNISVKPGASIASVGRGSGFLPEWEMSGDMSDDIRRQFLHNAPEWILTGEDAAQEHLIEQMTGDILSGLPENVSEAAKDNIAPRIHISGKITGDLPSGLFSIGSYKMSIDLRVRAVYSTKIVPRNAVLDASVSVFGLYPAKTVRTHLTEKAAELIIQALAAMYEGN